MTNESHIIIPAILEKDLRSLRSKLKIFDGLAPKIQIDILDGKLVDKVSWPYSGNFLDFIFPIKWEKIRSSLQIHLMVDDNLQFLAENYKLVDVSSEILLQIESRDAESTIKSLKNKGVLVGASIMMSTDISKLEPYIKDLDMVQFMCIDRIGAQGSSFNPKVLNRIKAFKKEYSDIKVVVDGGVKLNNLEMLLKAGADEFAVGSAILASEDPVATYKKMSEILTRLS